MEKTKHDEGKLELVAVKNFAASGDLYKVVDFLNKSLKEHKLMFGLTKKGENMTVSIYEV
jgi:hypothetical protein